MAIIDKARVCEFAGVIDIPIRQFTNALPDTTWDWQYQTLYALQNFGHWDGAAWVGTSGRIFDFSTGITTFEIGNVDPGLVDNNWMGASYVPNDSHIYAPVNAEVSLTPNNTMLKGINSSVPLTGGTVVRPWLTQDLFEPGPEINNTQFAQPYSNNWWQTKHHGIQRGHYLMWINDLVGQTAFWRDNGAIQQLYSPAVMQWDISLQLTRLIPYQGTNWIANGGDILNRNLIETQFDNDEAVRYNLTYQSPGGGFNMNTRLRAVLNIQQFSTSELGFMWWDIANTNINGKVYQGYGVLIRPDGKKYWILNIVPTDVSSLNWRSTTPVAKLDRNGYFFTKNGSDNTVVWSSFAPLATPPVLRYPAIPIINTPQHNMLYR